MNQVSLNTHGKLTTDRSRLGFAGFGDTTEEADGIDAIDPLPTAGNNWCASHERLDFIEKVTPAKMTVVIIKQVVGQRHHFYTDQLETLALELPDYVANEVSLNGIRLDEHQCAFHK